MQYRPEIDGLRAIAVLPVILFHAGFGIVPGGYVGVDVFFVISGYLITTLLVQDLDAGRYSLARFYERRARRILPALFVVTAATMPLALLTMLPGQIEDFSASIASLALFLSNFYFLSQVDYFAPAADLQPLLHTWSLAVEEQFYLLYPPGLALLWRRGLRRVVGVLAMVALASLVLAQWGAGENPGRNFFFTGSRVWELLAGSLVALLLRSRHLPRQALAAALGLAMILGAVLIYDAATPFPSLWTLLPVLGTALVLLFAQSGTVAAALLSSRPLVGIGLVSYSAYLWHHPLFAFARLHWGGDPPPLVMALLVGLTFGLAWATWAFVEQPFRRKAPLLPRRRSLFGAAALMGVAFLGVGIAGKQSNGFDAAWRAMWPGKAEILDAIIVAQTAKVSQDDGACIFNVEQVDAAIEARLLACRVKYGPGVGVLGDSHGIDLFGIVSLGNSGPFVAGFTKPGCRPGREDRACPYASFKAFTQAHPGTFSVVIFSMSGAALLVGVDGVSGTERAILSLPMDQTAPTQVPDRVAVDRVMAILADLAQVAPLVWLGPRTEPEVPLEWLVKRGCTAGLMIRPGTEANYDTLDRFLQQTSPVPYLSQNAAFGLQFPRDFGGCDGLLWSDGDHLSAAGEAEMAQRLDIALRARSSLP